MQPVSRPYALAGTALAAASLVTVTPIAPGPSALTIRSIETRLVDGDSILNIPFNLFQDIVNIPNTEVEAMNVLASSLLFSGNWWTPDPTNIWGTDPGDIGHYMGLIDMLIPFQQISGQDQPEIDPTADADGTAGLAQQLALLAAAELPVSASCDADWCSPLVPTTPITGFTSLDRDIWFVEELTGQQQFPLFDNWFTVPLSELANGYTFDAADDPGIVEPNNGVGADGSVPSEFGFDGTIPGPDGENLMPWSGDTFTLNLLGPFQDFYNSLLAPPEFSNFEFPSLTEFVQAMQSLLAGLVVAFDPYIEGSPACPGSCDLLPAFATMQAIVQDIGNLVPGNPLITEWLDLYNTPSTDPLTGLANPTGMDNGATQEQVDFAVQFAQGLQNAFDLGNPPPTYDDNPFGTPQTPEPVPVDPALQNLITFMQDSGEQSFAQDLANLVGFTPATYPLDYATYTPPTSLDELLSYLGLGFLADSGSVAGAAPDFLAELANQASLMQIDLLNIATLGLM